MQIARLRISYKLLWYQTDGIEYVNNESQKITETHLKICQTTKQPLSNFEPLKSWKYKQLWGLGRDPGYLYKKV